MGPCVRAARSITSMTRSFGKSAGETGGVGMRRVIGVIVPAATWPPCQKSPSRPLPFTSCSVPSARLPVLAPEIPRSGGPVSRAVGRAILSVLDWRVVGDMPNLRKFVIIVAPHTSNWDFPVGMGAKLALGIQASWVGKHTIFFWPFGALLKSLGGIPVDRSATNDIVQHLVDEFSRRERMVFALAPEGTRKKVERWKTGFYHVARGAGVPIVPVALDFGAREVRIMQAFPTTGDADADIAALRSMFEGVKGRNRQF